METTASHRGGDKFAAGDFNKALGYYQDALLACPNDDRAEVNVARSYEALGNKVAAINLYRKVADTQQPHRQRRPGRSQGRAPTPASHPHALTKLAPVSSSRSRPR